MRRRHPKKAAAAKARRVDLQALCAELGARYLTGPATSTQGRQLNNGLASARGDLVLVLDADHVPFRSLLAEPSGTSPRIPSSSWSRPRTPS